MATTYTDNGVTILPSITFDDTGKYALGLSSQGKVVLSGNLTTTPVEVLTFDPTTNQLTLNGLTLGNGTSAPSSPVRGTTWWFNPTLNTLNGYDGTGWQSEAALATKMIVVTDPRWGASPTATAAVNTTAFNAAFAAAQGGAILIPNGTYPTNGTITVTGPVDIYFESVSAVIQYTGTGDAISIANQKHINVYSGTVDISGAGTNAIGWHASGIWFGTWHSPRIIMGGPAGSNSNQTGMLFQTSQTGGQNYGTFLISIFDPNLQESSGSATGWQYGIRTLKTVGDTTTITHFYVYSGWLAGFVTAGGAGIWLDSVAGGAIRGTAINNVQDAVYVQNSSSVFFNLGETGTCAGYRINFGSGNSTLSNWTTNYNGNCSDNNATYTPNGLYRDSIQRYASPTDQTYFYTLASAFNASESLTLTAQGGATAARKILTWAQAIGMKLYTQPSEPVTVQAVTGTDWAVQHFHNTGGESYVGANAAANQFGSGGLPYYLSIVGPNSDSYGVQILTGLAQVARVTVGPGVQVGTPTGGDKGAGTINIATADGYLVNNVALKNITETLSNKTLAGPIIGVGGTAVTLVQVYAPTLTPTQMAAAIGAVEQTFTVTGVTTADKIIVNGPAPTALCPMVAARVSTTNTVALTFANLTAALCTPAAGTYSIVAIRS